MNMSTLDMNKTKLPLPKSEMELFTTFVTAANETAERIEDPGDAAQTEFEAGPASEDPDNRDGLWMFVEAILHGTPQPRKTEPRLTDLREFPLRLRRLRPGELVEERCRHQTAAEWEAATFGAEIDDRRTFRLRGRNPTDPRVSLR